MAEGGPSPPDLDPQKNEISTLIKKTLKKDDTWYLVDNKWFKQWKKYVGYDTWDTCSIGEQTTHPGPVDNSPLLKEDDSGEIKDHLIDELDYVLVPEEAWNLLVSWYGLTEGQKPIARKVIEYGMFVKHCKVEVYLMELKLCQNGSLDNYFVHKFSKVDTIEEIEKNMRRIFNISSDKETRLWNRYSSNTYEHLSDKDRTVQDAGLYQGQVLVIEQKNDDGTWPRSVKSTSSALSYSSTSSSGAGETKSYGSSTNTIATRSYSGGNYGNYGGNSYGYDCNTGVGNAVPGLCGLSNLGNTCFMNAALQCMSNTPPLTKYFFTDKYKHQLNRDNPLGMKGEIAISYAELIKAMWSGNYSYAIPRPFKMAVGRFAPQFSGYQQQDCQELMAFLLDGLHEDLNRVKKKPYIELKEAQGRPDKEVALEAWDNYRKRNDSIIVDIFHGLLKSTLVCPTCKKISVTFDPFCYLSLPLPSKKERQVEIILIQSDPSKKPLKMKVTVSKTYTAQDVCNAVAKLANLDPEKLLVTEVCNHRFARIYQNTDNFQDCHDRTDVYVYEFSFALNREDKNKLILPVYMREKRIRPGGNSASGPYQLFGYPLYVDVPKDCTYDELYNYILKRVERFINPANEDDRCSENNTDLNGEAAMRNGEDECDSENEDGDKTMATNDSVSNKSETDRLFTIQSVNENSSLKMESFQESGNPLKLTTRTYLAIDWNSKDGEQFFNEKLVEERVIHDSCNENRLKQKKQVIQLSECLELFTTTEKLGADDPWFCPVCRKHQQATKKFDLWSLPEVLIIHLKRFSYNRYWRDKLDTMVEFPVNNLDMGKYIISPDKHTQMYNLIAVANHYGGMGGGHYTAYCKNKNSNQWHYFDDSSVSAATEDNVVSKAAYVLFYMRSDSASSPKAPRSSNVPAALGGAPQDDAIVASGDEPEGMDLS